MASAAGVLGDTHARRQLLAAPLLVAIPAIFPTRAAAADLAAAAGERERERGPTLKAPPVVDANEEEEEGKSEG